jgi:hypothetical protein
MIRYALRCAQGHAFEGWFRDARSFEAQRDGGQLGCAECGSTEVDRALMAPSVATGRRAAAEAPMTVSPAERALSEMRRRLEAGSTYVGPNFAAEARAMHAGTSEHKAIHGEAAPAEARKLIEEGVPIAPLPFAPRQKAN